MIAYSYINNNKEPILLLYNPAEKKYKNITKNFSIKDIGHTKLIYDLEKDSQGNVKTSFL